ncbi:echinoderm microtubule-associated protein-like 3 isoform X4 [Tachysurus ichikawai]
MHEVHELSFAMNPGAARVLSQSFCVDVFSKPYRHSTSSLDGLHHTSDRRAKDLLSNTGQSIKMFIRGRPITMYIPSNIQNYEELKMDLPSEKLELDWVLAVHPNKVLIASGQTAGVDKDGKIPEKFGAVRTIADVDGEELLVGTTRNAILRGTFSDGFVAIVQGHSSFITHLDWSKDGKYIMSNSGDYEILYSFNRKLFVIGHRHLNV